MKTTLNAIRAQNPCREGWVKLVKNLQKRKTDSEPVDFLTILESNGPDDALWCLRTVEGYDKEFRKLTADLVDVMCDKPIAAVQVMIEFARASNSPHYQENIREGHKDLHGGLKGVTMTEGQAQQLWAAQEIGRTFAAKGPWFAFNRDNNDEGELVYLFPKQVEIVRKFFEETP